MSHVDEGTLHAYLDGELPPNERRDVEAHVAQCAACKERLAEERALFDRASALLASARPVERPVPPFEQVRRAHKRRPWNVSTPVAWAASIVLALGLGYYLRNPGTNDFEIATEPQSAAPADDRIAMNEAQEQSPAPAPVNRSRQTRPPETHAEEIARSSEGVTIDSLRFSDANSGVVAIQPQVYLRGAKAAPAVRAQRAADTLMAPPESTAKVVGGVSALVLEAGEASARRDESRSVRNLVATTWPIISRGKAASLLGDKPVGVPGLATRSIRRSPGPDSTVVVEQALDSATVIQIFQRPATARSDSVVYSIDGYARARESAPAAAPAPADRLARFVGKLRVEISGPVSADSLNRLLEQVEPLP